MASQIDSTNNHQPLTPAERVWGQPNLRGMRGFLPLVAPYVVLGEFADLNDLLNAMPVITKAGQAGLLAENKLRQACDQLKDHTPSIQALIHTLNSQDPTEAEKDSLAQDLVMLFRDYQYLKMGYLFESVHHGDASASPKLPSNIAQPLVLLADVFQQKPWLEYASGYVLVNSQFQQVITADKVNLIRQWHGGRDEFYFQTVHSIIEWETPELFAAIADVIEAVESANELQITAGMRQGIAITRKMLAGLKQMTKLSRPAYYSSDVRPQIQGLVGNCGEGKLFPEAGVYFEAQSLAANQESGVYINDIRGQTGAQSSIIPLLDNFLGITDFYAPGHNPLTNMLREFRYYRPRPHTALLELVESEHKRLNLRHTLKNKVPLLLAEWTQVVAQFREFHFFLAMAYIVKPGKAAPKTQSRAVGTGGSPTPSYLPQHVKESLEALADSLSMVDVAQLSPQEQQLVHSLHDYLAQTFIANDERSKVVGDYLAGKKTQSELEESVDSTETAVQ